MIIKEFFDEATYTLTYVVHGEKEGQALIVDPVWDYDSASGKVSSESVEKVLRYLESQKLEPIMCLETHAHADHLSAAQVLKKKFPQMKVAVSERIKKVQEIFVGAFNLQDPVDGSQFDYLLTDHEELDVAGFRIKVIPTPGHTPACSSYLINDAVFTGDAIFMPDYGVGRCDFPGGDAHKLYKSITENLYTLPDQTRVFVGHDYQPGGRELKFETTIAEQKKSNVQLSEKTSEADFVEYRQSRDKTLNAPKLLYPSIQVNILAGQLPKDESNGTKYLKVPLKVQD